MAPCLSACSGTWIAGTAEKDPLTGGILVPPVCPDDLLRSNPCAPRPGISVGCDGWRSPRLLELPGGGARVGRLTVITRLAETVSSRIFAWGLCSPDERKSHARCDPPWLWQERLDTPCRGIVPRLSTPGHYPPESPAVRRLWILLLQTPVRYRRPVRAIAVGAG